MSLNSERDNNQDAVDVIAAEEESAGEDESSVCPHCHLDTCWKEEIEPTLLSLVEIYGGYMENRKVRFKLYSEAVKSIHGTCLGKGVRKQLPGCVTRFIQSLAPDRTYTGFVENASS